MYFVPLRVFASLTFGWCNCLIQLDVKVNVTFVTIQLRIQDKEVRDGDQRSELTDSRLRQGYDATSRRVEGGVIGYQLIGRIIKLGGEERSLACLLAKAFGLGNLGGVRW
jgi:hypothetical protein